MKSEYIQYYVEGEIDKKIVDILKTDLYIKSGNCQVLNPVTQKISTMHLRTLKPKTMVVLVFDTDAGNKEILNNNIQLLKEHKSVSEVVTIPQVSNLEDELVRCCNINRIEDLLSSRSAADFKRDVMRVTNLSAKLKAHGFNIDHFWGSAASGEYSGIPNQASVIKESSITKLYGRKKT